MNYDGKLAGLIIKAYIQWWMIVTRRLIERFTTLSMQYSIRIYSTEKYCSCLSNSRSSFSRTISFFPFEAVFRTKPLSWL